MSEHAHHRRRQRRRVLGIGIALAGIVTAAQLLVDNAYYAFLGLDALGLMVPIHRDWSVLLSLITLLSLAVVLVAWLARTGQRAARGERRAQRSLIWVASGAAMLLILILWVATARAAPAQFGDGFRIGNGDDVLTIATGAGVLVELEFDVDGAPILNGTTLDLEDPGTALSFQLTRWDQNTIRLQGAPGLSTTLRLAGLGGAWRALGVPGEPILTGGGTLIVPAGVSLVELTRVSSTSSTSGTTSGDSSSRGAGDSSSTSPRGGGFAVLPDSGGFSIPLVWLAIGAGLLLLLVLARRRRRRASRRRGRAGALVLVLALAALVFLVKPWEVFA